MKNINSLLSIKIFALLFFFSNNLFAYKPKDIHPSPPLETTSENSKAECRAVNGCLVNVNSINFGPECPTAGNPINLATGNKFHKETIEITNDIKLELFYNSQATFEHSGSDNDIVLNLRRYTTTGWLMNYEAHIGEIFNTFSAVPPPYQVWRNVRIARPDGKILIFRKATMLSDGPSQYDGEWTALNPTVRLKLTRLNSGTQWKLITTEDTIEKYTIKLLPWGSNNSIIEQAVLSSIRYPNGRTNYIHTFSNDTAISSISNDFGQQVSFNYLANDQLFSLEFNPGNGAETKSWFFGYSATQNLTFFSYPDGTKTTYHYESTISGGEHLLTGITDRRGVRYSTYDYDAHKLAFESTHANNSNYVRVTYSHNDLEERDRTVLNSKGQSTTYTVVRQDERWKVKNASGPGCSTCTNTETSYIYDNRLNVSERTKNGKTTRYADYTWYGEYGSKIEGWDTDLVRYVGYTYDTDFLNKPTSIAYGWPFEGHQKIVSYVYDDNANVISKSLNGYNSNNDPLSITTTYKYEGPDNQITEINGPKWNKGYETPDIDRITSFEYYPNLSSEGFNRSRLKKITNPAGIILRDNIQYSSTGKILSEDHPNGLNISYTYYSGNDRLETISYSDGTKTITAHMSYLASGEIQTIIQNYGTPDASTITMEYDDAHRLTKTTDQQGNYIQYVLDSEGNRLEENTYDPQNVLKKTISKIFDDYSRLNTVTQSGVTNDFDYAVDGNLDQQANGNGIITHYDYDALDRLTQITQDMSTGTQVTANTITSFEYDRNDRIQKVTDANNHDTLYEYDDLGNLTSLTSPDTGIDTFTHDAAGNTLSKTDANGNTANFTYDAANRRLTADYPGTDLDVTFVYDQGTNGLNRLSSFSDSKSSTTLSYDKFGNLTGKSQTVNDVTPGNNVTATLAYTFDAANRLSTITYPSGLQVTYQYNNINQITNISTIINGQNVDIIDNASYLPMGPLNAMDLGNGLHYSASYDNGYRLDSYEFGTVQYGYYNYDNNHNITYISDGSGGGDVTSSSENKTTTIGYEYDNLDRLKYENKTGGIYDGIYYSYDKVGNRTQLGPSLSVPTDYEYDPDSNKLLNVGYQSTQRSYDNNGNTLSKFSSSNSDYFTYNAANRMNTYTSGTTLKAEYFYNGIGQRIYKKYYNGSNVPVYFFYQYNSTGQILYFSKYKGSNVNQKWTRETIWMGDKPIAQVRTTYSGGVASSVDIYYILTDHLNTPRKVTDATGTVHWSWNSTAFGSTLADVDVDGDGLVFGFILRFPGQLFDSESGQHYNYFRNYEPATGRYLESDPIGLEGGWNTYGYVSQNPLIFTDPTGQKSILRTITRFIFPWLFNERDNHNDLSVELERYKTDAECETRDSSGLLVSPVASSLPPPGDCNYGTQKELQDKVNDFCSRPKKCEFGDDFVDLVIKAENARQCGLSRNKINKKCYRGGDQAHRNEAIQAFKHQARCEYFMN